MRVRNTSSASGSWPEDTPVLVRALEESGHRVESTATQQPAFDEVFTRLIERHS